MEFEAENSSNSQTSNSTTSEQKSSDTCKTENFSLKQAWDRLSEFLSKKQNQTGK